MKRQPVPRGIALWRQWPRSRSRGAADILATILIVLIVVVLAALLVYLAFGFTTSTANAPGLSTALALGTPQESVASASGVSGCTVAPCNFYNMSVQEAATHLELHDLSFEIIAQNGSALVPPGGIIVLNAANAIVGQYGYSTGWTTGLDVQVTSSLEVVLYTSGSPPLSLSGDNLRVIGVSAYSGSISVHIY